MKKFVALIGCTLFLAGCGGGGGGGGGASLISEWLGTDPNAASWTGTDPGRPVTVNGKSYDFRNGSPDQDGAAFAALFDNPARTYTFSSSVMIFGGVVSSAACHTSTENVNGCGPTISAPNADVIAAWKDGWTGKDVNVLVVDNLFGNDPDTGKISAHAALVGSLVQRYAIASNIYGINYSSFNNGSIYNFDGSPADHSTPLKIGVINASFDGDISAYMKDRNGNTDPRTWSVSDLLSARNDYKSFSDAYLYYAKNGFQNISTSSAVITKSAGNFLRMDSQYTPLSYYLAHDPDTGPRTLIVGALDATGSVTKKTDIAYYSNVAGTDEVVQSRFLLASGLLPFDANTVSYEGIAIGGYTGTSFAAPRVAGYAAIIQQKFPNLTAANTADILLQTARYDTLACYPDCIKHKDIYGQGEASLSHALAPYGALH